MSRITRAKGTTLATTQAPVQHAEMALLCQKDGASYWIRGYEVFDPSLTHSTSGGKQPLKVKTRMSQMQKIPLMLKGQQAKPVFYDASRITAVVAGKHYFTFAEVLGTAGTTGGVILDAAIETDVDDLSMGVGAIGVDDDEATA